ncbi:Myc-type, basic helix-loop-helix (bHLH) domain-containing protein [Artemisia annua]|uniref:Myc-type, basic helix-loop-helix (BHLH) domain-containing protein n=1 Tax=Artemisia annua TaxID=35608 RepID=A0A2U1PGR7_ARTAN|nr:Myc-type, basic helix-loop-helix (bHLH) domain-containing protein [Artemisia annua]
MVCQSAGQTTFRALKHLNGTAGSATIIVKVIACFQPLQDCQGFDSWFRDQQTDWQSPNPNLSSAQFGLGPRVSIPSFGNMVSPEASTRQEQPCGWFYGLPRYRQGLIPVVNSTVKEQLPVVSPNVTQAVNGVQKKFLVFDQSGDQTTLIYSSGVGTAPARYEYPSLNNNPKPQYGSYPVHVDETIKEDNGNDSSSEMREDTEELNALLFGEQKRENVIGEEEEVASSGGPTKKRKFEDEGNIVNALEDTASSGKSGIYCSGNDGNGVFEEEFSSFSCGNKRPRIEKMKETINLIQNLIPGDKNGKNAIMVIDEAIEYLRNLKVKAKALGLDSLVLMVILSCFLVGFTCSYTVEALLGSLPQ